jgi:hypothetical protein
MQNNWQHIQGITFIPPDTFGSSLRGALGKIDAIDKICSKDNVAHAIVSAAPPRQIAWPILVHHEYDTSISLSPFNSIDGTFRVLHLAQWSH